MGTNNPRHLRTDRVEEDHAVVETPEHEIVDFDGCSADELEAKLHDFETWAK